MQAKKYPQLPWVDAIKGWAILGVMLVHLTERIPEPTGMVGRIFYFLGMLGDHAPGVFILLSGFGLTLSGLRKGIKDYQPSEFYQKRLIKILPLYMVIYLLFIAGLHVAKMGPSETMVSDPETFLRLFGLGFTDATFFYINPSWWFVWFILQMYLVFPWLYRLFQRTQALPFLLLTIGLTIATRLGGMFGLRFNESPYFWELGIFFGSRLAEFAMGMVLARWVHQPDSHSFRERSLLIVSIPAFVVGVAAMYWEWGRLVFPILTTLGMTGIFYFFFQKTQKGLLGRAMIWLGVHSYAIFLFHQVPLKVPSKLFADQPLLYLGVGTITLAFSVLGSYIIEHAVNWGTTILQKIRTAAAIDFLLLGLSGAIIGGVFLYKGGIDSSFIHQTILLGFLLLTSLLIFMNFRASLKYPWVQFISLAAILTGLGIVFGFPPEKRIWAIGFGFLLSAIITGSIFLTQKYRWGWALPLALFIGVVGGEWYAQTYSPQQSGEVWGELPALMTDEKLTFKLQPNKVTHLKYDEMDFVLKTNDYGMNSPEITPDRPTSNTLRVLILGDAISMPEGFSYEEAYPGMLKQNLAEAYPGREVEVINAAVTGYAPHHQVALLPELMQTFTPDVVVYQFFDEFIQNVPPELAYDSTFIREMQLSMGFFPDGTKPMLYDHIVRSQLLVNIRKRLGTLVKEKMLKKPKPNRYHLALINYFEKGENPLYTADKLNILGRRIAQLKEMSISGGAAFLMVFVPPAAAVTDPDQLDYFPWNIDLSNAHAYDRTLPQRHVKEICQAYEIPYLDMMPIFENHPVQPVYFTHFWHLNQEGHRVMATEIKNELISIYLAPPDSTLDELLVNQP
ncbi:MAG: acyltransferase family protein [Bacteroidota bacterium]